MIEDEANPPREEHAHVHGDGQLVAHRARERLRADDEEDHAEHRVEGVEVAEHDAQQEEDRPQEEDREALGGDDQKQRGRRGQHRADRIHRKRQVRAPDRHHAGGQERDAEAAVRIARQVGVASIRRPVERQHLRELANLS